MPWRVKVYLPRPNKTPYRARKDGNYTWLQSGLRTCGTKTEIDEFWGRYQGLITELPKGWQVMLTEERDRLKGGLS